MEDRIMQKLAESLTAKTTEIIPFLPYLLQDFEELDSCPDEMVELVTKYMKPETEMMTVLDLACGKGAVSLRLAQQFGCSVAGIDLIPEFIEDAWKKTE